MAVSRFTEVRNIIRHRKAFKKVAKSFGKSYPFHDLHKMINVLILGDKLATKLHRKFSKHHEQNNDIRNKIEAIIDWECARFTKPDKQLTAYEAWQKLYSHIDMRSSFEELGLLK